MSTSFKLPLTPAILKAQQNNLQICYKSVKSVNYLELDFIKIYTLLNLLIYSRQNTFCYTLDFQGS